MTPSHSRRQVVSGESDRLIKRKRTCSSTLLCVGEGHASPKPSDMETSPTRRIKHLEGRQRQILRFRIHRQSWFHLAQLLATIEQQFSSTTLTRNAFPRRTLTECIGQTSSTTMTSRGFSTHRKFVTAQHASDPAAGFRRSRIRKDLDVRQVGVRQTERKLGPTSITDSSNRHRIRPPSHSWHLTSLSQHELQADRVSQLLLHALCHHEVRG